MQRRDLDAVGAQRAQDRVHFAGDQDEVTSRRGAGRPRRLDIDRGGHAHRGRYFQTVDTHGPPRGTPIWYTPPLTRPCAPMISAIWVVSRPKAGAEVGAAAAGGVPVRASASCTAVARATARPRPEMWRYMTCGISPTR